MRNTKADPSNKEGSFIISNMDAQKVIVYVDGFNFFYGLKSKKWKRFYWLDMVKFFSCFIKPYQELVEVNYFSARPSDPGQHDRQDKLFVANSLNPKFHLYLGKYLKKKITCRNCGSVIHSFEEKETDVRIATHIISDVYNKKCDITIIVSADSDLIPPIELIKEIAPFHKIFVYFPPDRHSFNLESLCNSSKNLGGSFVSFNNCLLPDKITLPSGYVIEKPSNWI